MSKIQSFNIALINENAFLPNPYLGNCKAHSQVIVSSLAICSFPAVSHVFVNAAYYI